MNKVHRGLQPFRKLFAHARLAGKRYSPWFLDRLAQWNTHWAMQILHGYFPSSNYFVVKLFSIRGCNWILSMVMKPWFCKFEMFKPNVASLSHLKKFKCS